MNKSSFFIVGQHAVMEALRNPKRKVLRVFLTEESKKNIHRKNPKKNIQEEVKVYFKSKKELDKYTSKEQLMHNGYVAEIEHLNQPDLKQFIKDKNNLTFVCLDEVTDPRNIGSLIRSAASFEIDGLIIMADHSSRVSNKLAHMANDISMIDISKYNFKDAIEYINSTELVNCSFSLDRETNIFYLIAEKDISPNSELFVHYGVQYWLDIDSKKYSINFDEKNFLIKLDTDPEFYSMVLNK